MCRQHVYALSNADHLLLLFCVSVYLSFQAQLFQVPGLQCEVQAICECLDTGLPNELRILLPY